MSKQQYEIGGIRLRQVSYRTRLVGHTLGLGLLMRLSAGSRATAQTAPDATKPLRQFLAAKSDLKLQRQGAVLWAC